MSATFITATGTGVGKTVLMTALCYQLRAQGREVFAVKPVISGFEADDLENDTCQIAASLGLAPSAECVRAISPMRFKEPLSPNLAAAREGRNIDIEALLDFCDKAINSFDITLIEGIGGSHVPLAKDFLVADWILDLGIPAILVTGSYLGALSHTLVSIEALQAMGVKLKAIAVSQSSAEPMPLDETVDALIEQAPGIRIFALPRIARQPFYEHAPDMTGILA